MTPLRKFSRTNFSKKTFILCLQYKIWFVFIPTALVGNSFIQCFTYYVNRYFKKYLKKSKNNFFSKTVLTIFLCGCITRLTNDNEVAEMVFLRPFLFLNISAAVGMSGENSIGKDAAFSFWCTQNESAAFFLS